ncbi:Pimeloyl-ACP methyl ester carboxylesterase [Streptosporangium subroseum]|uniref:Pimeloyl-ACP methyl ester carboxylesterase n=1 Tax=Streptosporangium subroseum TaxID=106412 RepID=A0A239NLG8_9ACTN|nr:alpha/beta hydrolase [Streptosporangium subroseum]SNT55751.1 Pimeloyl-ACP methyl ester carboxylesterase [Streptosporangium subroseum]
MAYLPVGVDHGRTPVELCYEDYGHGRPVVLLHDWPLSRHMWAAQVPALVEAGYRVIAYDRRGFGDSSRPWDGYDYDSLAADLHAVLEQLKLSEPTLVGAGMGAAEIVRYLTRYGTAGVRGVVLAGAALPYLYRSYDNPQGPWTPERFDRLKARLDTDRFAMLDTYATRMFRADGRVLLSDPHRDHYRAQGAAAAPQALNAGLTTLARSDLRGEVAIPLPTLVIHGEHDELTPFPATGAQIGGSAMEVIQGAPHGCQATHPLRFNRVLLRFLANG